MKMIRLQIRFMTQALYRPSLNRKVLKSALSFCALTLLCLSSLTVSAAQDDKSRAVRAIRDLSHQSGKLGAYRALIIGINDYQDESIPDLETALNDARAMASILRDKYGFKVDLLLDRKATKKAIFSALRKLAATTKEDDSVLIYYAGHGELDRVYDDGWWVPADAKPGDPMTYLDNVQVQKSMRSMKARHVLLISDSCYSGTLFGKARAMPSVIDEKYYLNLYNDKSRWGMTSGNKEPVSDEGTGNHSVFAYQLLKELRQNDKPYLSTQELYTRIAPIVGNNSEQTPLARPVRNTGDQGGEFVFVASTPKAKSGTSKVSPGPITGKTQDSAELQKERIRLEQERLGLERLKVGIERKKLEAERNRLDAEKKNLETAKLRPEPKSPPVSKPEAIVRDGTFIAHANGVVRDTKTGLEWIAGPERNMPWSEAKSWVKSLNIDGGGWRVPTIAELKTIYQKGKGSRNITPLLKTRGWHVWSSERKGPLLVWRFQFQRGEREHSRYDDVSVPVRSRVFAVRSRSDG